MTGFFVHLTGQPVTQWHPCPNTKPQNADDVNPSYAHVPRAKRRRVTKQEINRYGDDGVVKDEEDEEQDIDLDVTRSV